MSFEEKAKAIAMKWLHDGMAGHKELTSTVAEALRSAFEAGAEQMRERSAEAVKEHVASIRAHDLKNPTKCAPCLTAELVLALPLSPEEPKS